MQVAYINMFRIYYAKKCDAHNAIRSFSHDKGFTILCERCLHEAVAKIANGHLTDPEDLNEREDLESLFSDWREACFK